ncbi:replication initiation factor domain-containing protein [Listeria booriae]|uniref:Replication initiation factor domain-containing protein n=1 Tax=Listeria booriae TaxID=1552123 RepID=A0A842B293_9LIST|nr:replication initiation factor domain-containing protein [Listeria booriae]MBC1796072.1 replication initiation factor domain-containing protein [Listeria booriae]
MARENISVGIDWLTIVFENLHAKDVFDNILDINELYFDKQPRGIRYKSYTTLYQHGNIQVYADIEPSLNNPKGTGCYLNMSGIGCHQLKIYLDAQKRSWKDFFESCAQQSGKSGFHITRMDVAIDDRNTKPAFTVAQLHRKCEKGEFISKSRHHRLQQSSSDKVKSAKTLYIGHRKSNIQYRFYDKDKEQAEKGNFDIEEMGSWKRTEIQLRDEKANMLASEIRSSSKTLRELAFGFLKGNLNFLVENPEQSNKSRWDSCRFWERFLENAEPVKLEIQPTVNTLLDTQDWLLEGGALAALKAFEFLEDKQALGGLQSLESMKKKTQFSTNLSAKIVTHLSMIGKSEFIPLVYEQTKQTEF